MNTAAYLRSLTQSGNRRAMPILSFPAIQKMGVNVRQLLGSSELQAQAMEIIARNTPSAAAVAPMDLSVEAQAFGAAVAFDDHAVPNVTGQMITDAADAEKLSVPPVGAGRTGQCVEAVRLAKRRITDRPVLAGVIGPFSLAGRLMDVTEIMYQCYDEPETVHAVLEKAERFLAAYCRAFRDAGADGVILAEPLAGLLSADMCSEFSCAYTKRIIDAVQTDGFSVIYHNCGNAVVSMLPELFAMNAAAYHFGNAVDMKRIMAGAPEHALCMGNIDPVGEFANGTPDSMKQAVVRLLDEMKDCPGFILSSGCDIPPHAKWENIRAFFEAAEEYDKRAFTKA